MQSRTYEAENFSFLLLMSNHPTLYLTDRHTWRLWLEENHETAEEIWLIYPKKATGKPRILYNDAVEEALCFGWIDSKVKSLDPQHSMQRFSPRKSKGKFSQPNIERLRWLMEHNMLHPKVLDSVKEALKLEFVFPEDIIEAIQENEEAWEHYQSFSESYRRIRIAYIAAARKRPEEFEKRLRNFIAKTQMGKIIPGHGGVEKYY